MPDAGNVRELGIDMDATFNWSVGGHMEKFIRGFKERKIYGVRCPACEKVRVPPRLVCERCFAETSEWVELGQEGTVESYTVGRVNVDGKSGGLVDRDPPEIIALIRPDGADTAIVHRIAEAVPEQVDIHMRVRAVWAEDTCGDLADLLYFRPTGQVQ